MNCCQKCFSCCTCRQGPKLVDWTFVKIGYAKWSLAAQMVCGTACSMVFVLATMGTLISVS